MDSHWLYTNKWTFLCVCVCFIVLWISETVTLGMASAS